MNLHINSMYTLFHITCEIKNSLKCLGYLDNLSSPTSLWRCFFIGLNFSALTLIIFFYFIRSAHQIWTKIDIPK